MSRSTRFTPRALAAPLALALGISLMACAPAPTVTPEVSAPAPPAPGAGLTWAPPALSAPSTLNVPTSGGIFNLDPAKDYRVVLPKATVTGQVFLVGGRNVVLVGGYIRPNAKTDGALTFKNWKGTLHVEGVRVDPGGSRGVEEDAIRVNSVNAGAIAQFQNIWVDQVKGSYAGFHGDVLQTWAGPTVLRVDRLTAFTDYQGFYLAPNHFYDGPVGKPWADIRNVDITMVGDGYTSFAMSDQGGDTDPSWLKLSEVWGAPNVDGCPEDAGDDDFQAAGIKCGSRPGGHFVPDGLAGINYVSPGYAS